MPEIGLRLQRQWHVMCPPCKMQMVNGVFLPTLKGAFGPAVKRMVTIELYSFSQKSTITTTTTTQNKNLKNDKEVSALVEETVQFTTTTNSKKNSSTTTTKTEKRDSLHLTNDLANQLNDDDRIVIRIYKEQQQQQQSWGLMKDQQKDDHKNKNNTNVEEDWIEFRRYDLDDIDDSKVNKTSWEGLLGRGSSMERRELRFESEQDAEDFQNELQRLKALVKERAAIQLATYHNNNKNKNNKKSSTIKKEEGSIISRNVITTTTTKEDNKINLLIEIVSAMDLPQTDIISTDPYIIVFMGKQEVHRTNIISKSQFPIWTVDTGSLFVLSQTAEEFFSSVSGLTLILKDSDSITTNPVVGRVEISQMDLLRMNGERMEYDLQLTGDFHNQLSLKSKSSSKNTNNNNDYIYFKPKLMIRVRPANLPYDINFLKQLHTIKKQSNYNNNNTKFGGIYADKSFVAPIVQTSTNTNLFFQPRETKIVDGITLHRVKPRPDPNNTADTEFMTKQQFNEEMVKPSTGWIAAGSGKLGKLYLEVLKCDDLPNMDIDGMTDAYCCIIYEDAIVNTDVINDTLSPRWLPWSQRAFVFSMQHPSSQILVGVSDYDPQFLGDNSPKAHDCIGRVTIDITNFAPDTDYMLTYDLHASVLKEDRPAVGTLTVRLRIEYDSYRNFAMGSLALPPLNYINLTKKSDFLTSYFVCCGEENLQALDMEAIGCYRTELEQYCLNLVDYISEATMAVVLWRGNFKLRVFGKSIWLPLHSIVAFVMATRLINNLDYLPSFICLTITWFFLATNELSRRNPSPWHGSAKFVSIWSSLIRNSRGPVTIDAYEDEAKIRKYNNHVKAHKEELERKKQVAEENLQILTNFLGKEQQATNSEVVEKMETKVGGGIQELNPLGKILLPIQSLLGTICVTIRVILSIVSWDEKYYAFVITNISLLLGIILLFVPWGFLIRTTLRIGIWIFLGPWMKLVDIFYIQKLNEEGDNEAKQLYEQAKAKLMTLNATRHALMMQKEDMIKLRDMKRYMFGSYITRCPQFKEYRFSDIPKPESTATPRYNKKKQDDDNKINIITTKHGQTLDGTMIPIWGDAAVTDEIEHK